MAESALTDQDLARIKDNLALLDEAERQIKQAEMAGIDVAPFKATVRDQRAQLNKIRSAYFPGK